MKRSRETKLRLDAQGRWFEDGAPVDNPKIIQAFNRWIARAPDGRYCLKNSVNWAYVEVEDAPIFVLSVEVLPQGLRLRLSDETEELLDPATLRQDEAGALYCDVRGGALPARFSRRATLELEPALEEDDQGLYLRLGERRVRPPVTGSPLHSGATLR